MKTAQHSVEMILVRQLAATSSCRVLVFDATGTVVFYNEPAERILGVRFEETGRIDREEAHLPPGFIESELPARTLPTGGDTCLSGSARP